MSHPSLLDNLRGKSSWNWALIRKAGGKRAVEYQSLFLPPQAVTKPHNGFCDFYMVTSGSWLYFPKLHSAWDVAASGELRGGGWWSSETVPGAQMGDGDKGLAGTSVPANWCVTERLKLLAGQLSD